MPNYTVPKITLQTPAFQPATFQPVIYTPQVGDLSLLSRSLDKLEERKEKTLQQVNNIKAAIANVKLNEAEDEWRNNYINEIQRDIDQAAQLGDYSTALTVATKLAGDAASNPELLAKAKENENYENWKKEIDTLYLNNKIDRDTRDYFMDTNKYKFSGVYDDNGNFKNQSLTEYAKPIQNLDLSGLFSWVGSTVAEMSGSSQGVGAKTATGANTPYYSDDIAALTHSGMVWSKKDYDIIKNVWDEAIKRHPEAIRYMEQQMDVNEWLLKDINKKLQDENLDIADKNRLLAEKQRLEEDLYVGGDVSKPYTPQEYLIASSDKTLKAMSYNRVNTTFNVSGGGGSSRSRASNSEGNGQGAFSSLNFNAVTAGHGGNVTSRIVTGYFNLATGESISDALGQNNNTDNTNNTKKKK